MEKVKHEKKLKVAIIGIGNIGKHHARLSLKSPSAKLIAICDTNSELLKEICPDDVNSYVDFKEMLKAESDIEAVHICTPINTHFEIALECLNQGKHLLLEKPICANSKEARTVLNKAIEKNLLLVPGHVERFNPVLKPIRTLLSNKELGEITSVIIRRVGLNPPEDKKANILFDLAVHDIDILLDLVKEDLQTVFARGGEIEGDNRLDYCEIFLGFDRVNAIMQCNWITPIKIRKMNITGTKGYVEVDYLKQKFKFFRSADQKNFDSFKEYVEFQKTNLAENVFVTPEEPLKNEIEYFYSEIRKFQSGQSIDRKFPEDAVKTLSMVEKILSNLDLID